MKKSLIFLFTLMLAGIVVGQDDQASQETMENADMSDGSTHWHGDCKAAGSDMTTDFTSSAGSPKGIVVELHSTSWTKVTQDIHEYKGQGPRILTIVYQASPDLKFSTHPEDYTNLGPIIGFGGAQVPSQMGQITALIDMPPDTRATASQDISNPNTTNYTIYPDKTTVVSFAPKLDQSPQTITGQMYPPRPRTTIRRLSSSLFRREAGPSRSPKFRCCPATSPGYRARHRAIRFARSPFRISRFRSLSRKAVDFRAASTTSRSGLEAATSSPIS